MYQPRVAKWASDPKGLYLNSKHMIIRIPDSAVIFVLVCYFVPHIDYDVRSLLNKYINNVKAFQSEAS